MNQDFLIVSDVDGTLLGDDASLERLAHWLTPRRTYLRLVYASGRFFDSVHQSVLSTPLPEPDFVIGGVGTEIGDYRAGMRLPDWPDTHAVTHWSANRARRALLAVPRLVEQPGEFQSFWKLSYFIDHASEEELKLIDETLSSAGIETDVIYSSNRDLDVLPRAVNKGSATAHLAAHLGVPPERVIVCGDTGNDLSMFNCGFRGVVVGNAKPELRENAGEPVYRANKDHAAGVFEGLCHWLEAQSELIQC